MNLKTRVMLTAGVTLLGLSMEFIYMATYTIIVPEMLAAGVVAGIVGLPLTFAAGLNLAKANPRLPKGIQQIITSMSVDKSTIR